MTRNRASMAMGLLTATLTWALAPISIARAENPHVLLVTSMGEIEIELFEKEAPETVENFLKYTKKGHYDKTIFHRIIKDFVVQGGGFDESMKQKAVGLPIKNESKNGLKNEKYTLSMARTNQPDSATSQFYINLKYNDILDRSKARDGFGYCVFGKVVRGQDVVDEMALVKTTNKSPHQDVPVKDIVLIEAKIVEPKKDDVVKPGKTDDVPKDQKSEGK